MNIGVVGVNHNLAPINVREAVSFTDTKKIEAINILLDREIDEIVILSTCNRSEIYISGENIQQKVDEVANFYKDYFGVKDIEQYLFKKTNLEAIQHLFDVTAGLDSLVVGEDQILGQVKDAHEFCMKLGATKKVFNKLFRDAVTTSKEIKTITKISQQPLSISYIGVKLLKEKMGTLEGKNALIVGLGKMNLLTLNHLEEENVKNIYIANRNIEKTKEIENKFDNIIPIEYSDRHKIIQEKSIDIVISATSSPHLVIKYDDMPKLDKKIYIMDIALPRDIDTKLKELKSDNSQILLSHRAELMNLYAENNYECVLSGHTHGGYIQIPFFGAIFASNQGVRPQYVNGVYTKANTTMIVSRGIGVGQFPFRLFNFGEILSIHLN